MAPKISIRSTRKRRRPVHAGEGFYPGEVIKILGYEGLDYSQLSELRRLIVEPDGSTSKKGWQRYTLSEIGEIRTAIELAGGQAALRRGRRLQWRILRETLTILTTDHGLSRPLKAVRLTRRGDTVLAFLGQTVFEPVSGQHVFAAMEDGLREYTNIASMKDHPKAPDTMRELEKLKKAIGRAGRAGTIPARSWIPLRALRRA